MNAVVVATRGSLLALTQTRWVVARLQALHPHVAFRLEVMRTAGDRSQAAGVPLSEAGGKGLFTRELEDALLDGRADLAVHSLKDMPTDLPDGLALGCVPEREDPRDALITADGRTLDELPAGARVGTSSLRRVAQLRHYRPDLTYVPLRGNVDTRLRKLEAGQCDALVMAAAGLHRAGFTTRIAQYLSPEVCLPAVGQGALAIEIRRDDERVAALVGALGHPETAVAVAAERSFLARITAAVAAAGGAAGAGPAGAPGQAPPLAGSCQTPVAAHATLRGSHLHLRGLVALPDGSRVVAWAGEGPAARADAIGTAVAEAVLAQGGAAILRQVHGG